MHHPQHRPLRLASAEPATVTLAAAYEGAVTKTSELNRAVSCENEGVRFGTYNAWVTKTPAPPSVLHTPFAPAALAVAR
jgi:hypothetical protein